MSNYPPGVTGLEWQIAGCDEEEAVRECGGEECSFSGDVTIYWHTRTSGMWECPECFDQHEEEASEPDEDWNSDR